MNKAAGSLSQVLGKRLAASRLALRQAFPAIAAGQSGTPIHKARVAMRRARVALKLCRPLLGRRAGAELAGEMQWLASMLGDVRTCDVFLEDLAGRAGHEGWGLLARRLEQQRAAALAIAIQSVGGERAKALLAGLTRAVRACKADKEETGADQILAKAVRKRLNRAVEDCEAIAADSAPERFHDLRKDVKNIRYLIDMMSSDQQPMEAYIAVRAVQEWLGRYQDLSSWIDLIHGWLEDDGLAQEDRQALMRISGDAAAERMAMTRRFPVEREAFLKTLTATGVMRHLKDLAHGER